MCFYTSVRVCSWRLINYTVMLSLVLSVLYISITEANAVCASSEIRPTTDSYDFIDDHVVDKSRGVVWQRCVIGKTWDNNKSKCTGSARNMTWDMASEYIRKIPKSNNEIWRLPTPFELMALVDFNCPDSTAKTKWFNDTDINFLWSGSTYGRIADYAWGLKNSRGELSYEMKNDEFQTLLIRSANK